MGKATIISGGNAGQYQIRVNIYKDKAEACIDDLQAEIDKIESADDVVFSPTLSTQASDLETLIDQYRQGIEDNRNTEESDRQLQKQLAYEQANLDDLEDELSDLQADRDQKQSDYVAAQDMFDDGEISQEELDWWEARYLEAEAAVVAKQSSVNSQTAVVNGIQAQLDAIDYAELDKQLEQIKNNSKTFLTWQPTEPLGQLETHLNLAESMLSKMAAAFNSSIEWYNDAVTANQAAQTEYFDLQEEQSPISQKVGEYSDDVTAAKNNLDAAQSEYETAYIQYLRGEITEAELQPYIDSRDAVLAVYSAALASYTYWQSQWDTVEVQKNQCVSIGTDTMYRRMNDTAAAYQQMSSDVGALRAFKNRQELKKTAMEKEIERLQNLIDQAEATQSAWCADLTEDLAADAEVGTIEINGEDKQILIHPGYNEAAVYDQERDGLLMPVGLATPAQALYNFMMLPGWQKWQSTYRVGEITAIDGDTCTVSLDPAKSSAQDIDINQAQIIEDAPIEYMSCNGAAFALGDRVVVRFTGQDWDDPKVIGFETEPQPCAARYAVIAVNNNTDHPVVIVWDCGKKTLVDVGISQPCTLNDLTNLTDWLENHPTDEEQVNLINSVTAPSPLIDEWVEGHTADVLWSPDYLGDFPDSETSYHQAGVSSVPDRDGNYPIISYQQTGRIESSDPCTETGLVVQRNLWGLNGAKLSFDYPGNAFDVGQVLAVTRTCTISVCAGYDWGDGFNVSWAESFRFVSPLDDNPAGNTISFSYFRNVTAESPDSVCAGSMLRWQVAAGNSYLTYNVDLFQAAVYAGGFMLQIYGLQYTRANLSAGCATVENAARASIVHGSSEPVEESLPDARELNRSTALEDAIKSLCEAWHAENGTAAGSIDDLALSIDMRI